MTSNFPGFDLDLWPSEVNWGQFFIPFENPYMTSYLNSMANLFLSRIFFRYLISTLSGLDLDLRPVKVIWRLKVFYTVWKPLYDFLFDFYWHFISYRFWNIWLQTFQGLTFDLWRSSEVKYFIQFESTYMTSYSTTIDTFPLSFTVFEIFDFKLLWVWPWPLTFIDRMKSNCFIPFESPYMTFYSTFIDTFSLSRTVQKIFDFKHFRVWPWSLTPKDHLR